MARKRRIKQFLTKTKDKVKKTVNKAKDKLQKAGDLTALAPLLPFKPVMVSILKKKGEPVSMTTKMSKLVPLFYQRVIEKKNKISYEELENLNEEQTSQIIGLVAPILDFIKSLVGRKRKGEKLNEDEEQLLEGAKEAEKTITESKDEGNWFEENKTIILLVAGAVVLFFVFKKK